MFRDAAEIMGSDPLRCHRSQVVAFRWRGFTPELWEMMNDSGELRPLSLEPLDLFVSEARLCTGERDGAPCLETLTPGLGRCRACDSFPVQECRFQPRCRGTLCEGTVCGEEHTVYLALFGPRAKVGMTRSSRLRERGIEQGADLIVELERQRSRYEAREAEQRISRERGLPQATSLQSLAESAVDGSLEEAVRIWEGMSPSFPAAGRPQVLDGYPLRGLATAPRVMPTAGKHRGELLGAKGRLAVYRDELGMLKALDLKDLVARFVGTSPSACAQSTLF